MNITSPIKKHVMVIKNLMAMFYAAISIGAIFLIVIVNIHIGLIFSGSDVSIVYSTVLLLIVLITGVMSYGLITLRRWVLYIHTINVILWVLLGIGIATNTIGLELLRTRDLSTALFITIAFIMPISFQYFLFQNRRSLFTLLATDRFTVNTIPVSIQAITAIPMASFFLVVFPILLLGIFSENRKKVTTIENQRYQVIVFQYPSTGVFTNPFIKVAAIDKNSLFKGEKELWIEEYQGNVKLEFEDSNVVMVIKDRRTDTLIINITEPSQE